MPGPILFQPRNREIKVMFAVDSHAHVFEQGLPLAPVRRHAPAYDATAETYIEILKANGLDMGLLVQPSFLGTDNSYLLAAMKKHPGKFRGVAVISPDVSDARFKELHEAGCTGFRLNLEGLPLPDLYAPEWTRVLRLARERGWHVELHRSSRDLPRLVRPLLESGVKIVIDHFGRPDPDLLPHDPVVPWILSLGVSRRVWVKISGTYRIGNLALGEVFAKTVMPDLLRAYGADRLLWGSDWPHTQHEDHIDYALTAANFKIWIPDGGVREIILRQSPAALFAPYAPSAA